MQDYVFLDFRPRITWLYPIWNALNASSSKTLQERRKRGSRALGDLAIAVATKLAILGTLVSRFNSDHEKLLTFAAEDAEGIQLNRETGTVWTLQNDILAYELLADIEAFVFEARSTYEILGNFLGTFCKVIFNRLLTEEDLKNILRNRGLDVEWTTLLRDERILFFHETAPWLALMFQGPKSVSPELLIVRKTVKTLDDPETFARLADYNRIYLGLDAALQKLQQYIVTEINRYETSEP